VALCRGVETELLVDEPQLLALELADRLGAGCVVGQAVLVVDEVGLGRCGLVPDLFAGGLGRGQLGVEAGALRDEQGALTVAQ
jgi:hypothetical protein